jgi:hypothetical protein
MLFDPHLTYRGSGDAFFMTMALVRILPSERKPNAVREQPATLSASGAPLQEVPA